MKIMTSFSRMSFMIGVVISAFTLKDKRFMNVEKYCIDFIKKGNDVNFAKSFLGGIYFDFKKYESSIDVYMDMMRDAVLSENDISRLVEALYRTGCYEKLIEVLVPLIEKYNVFDLYWYLGRSYYLLERNDEAERIYKDLLSRKPDKKIRNDLALIYMKKGLSIIKLNVEQAGELLSMAYELDPEEQLVMDSLNVLERIKSEK